MVDDRTFYSRVWASEVQKAVLEMISALRGSGSFSNVTNKIACLDQLQIGRGLRNSPHSFGYLHDHDNHESSASVPIQHAILRA